MKTYILVDGAWVEGAPAEGEKYKKVLNSGAELISYWSEPPTKNKISITSHSVREVVNAGDPITVHVDILDPSGDVITDLNTTFQVPIGIVNGQIKRTISMEFISGQCEKTISWPESGEFEITEELVNMHLPESEKFEFEGFNVSVIEV